MEHISLGKLRMNYPKWFLFLMISIRFLLNVQTSKCMLFITFLFCVSPMCLNHSEIWRVRMHEFELDPHWKIWGGEKLCKLEQPEHHEFQSSHFSKHFTIFTIIVDRYFEIRLGLTHRNIQLNSILLTYRPFMPKPTTVK